MQVVAVAGMVGVGKTTLARRLAEAFGYRLLGERASTNPYLEDYYADFKRWSFSVQVFFLAERLRGLAEARRAGVSVVQDRTVYEDAEIFARLHHETGHMDERDWQTYRLLYETLVDDPTFRHPDLVVYLTGSFEAIYRRIRCRGRRAELSMSRAYWEALYQRYNAWIQTFHRAPVVAVSIDEYDLFTGRGVEALLTRLEAALPPRRSTAPKTGPQRFIPGG
ncbi:deoxynucleoside kinase [Hydrogenibacillus schlegelii]|uniref:Deoxynucleoside kinase domain-containing protein n=1 Tax=Hydrogenibacillus schlegelii TaxID=1484 RepID=A0A179ILN6_HYDSH|nr:deoxynucleoside kinase [Hydrogenibacillus schlegelii]OAR03586.1 hypothetical protein SA87_02850 [Hydrogenibacillus schlegelii]